MPHTSIRPRPVKIWSQFFVTPLIYVYNGPFAVVGVALDHVFQYRIIRYFEFEKSETTSSRMSVTYAQIRSQNLRTQNIRICLGTFLFLF